MKNNIIFILLIFSNLHLLTGSTIVETSFGRLEGSQVGNFHAFKKIPFAKPPIGKLRFQRPELPDKWERILNAKEYGPACMSNSSETSSPQKWVDEDCLHLNIFTSENCLKSKNCAVVVYIHGGELLYDSAVMFNDTILFDTFASRDVVLAIPAFRLGIFSHFVVKDQSVAPTNLGLFDIIRGMEFVKSEVYNFGGDNKKITVFGHSYGGHIVSTMQFSTKINNDMSLFQQTISMSTVVYFDTLKHQIERTERFGKAANCLFTSETELTKNQQDILMMECLQNKDAMELLRIQRSLEDAGFPLYDGLVIREPLIQEVPFSQLFETPQVMPSFVGCTFAELDKFMAYHDIAKSMGYKNHDECDGKYRNDRKENNYDFENHADETLAILAQTKLKVDKMLEKNITTFLYEYSYPKHAAHTEDLSYLFGVHSFERDENEVLLAKVYQEMFVNFVKNGEPGNGFVKTNKEDSPFYNVYWNKTSGERPMMKNHFEPKVVKYWLGDMFNFDRNITKAKGFRSFKMPAARLAKISSDEQLPYMFISIFLVSLIFITGCLFGKYCCPGSRDRHLYIRLEGNDHDWHTVKNL